MFCQRAGDFWALCRIYVFPFNQVLAKPQRYGRFSSPLRNSEILTRYHSSKYTPSVSHSLDSSLREGAGERPPITSITRPLTKYQWAGDFWGFCVGGFFPFNWVLAKPWGYGRFSSPLRNSEGFPFHRSTGPYYSGWAPWNSTWRGSICQWFWVMVSSFWESFSSRPGLRVIHSRVGPAPLRQKAAPVVRTRASMRE